MARNMTGTNWGGRILALGYVLMGGVVDSLGRTRKYRTSPSAGSGPINYFDTLAQLVHWVRQVEDIRLMQENPMRHAEKVYICGAIV